MASSTGQRTPWHLWVVGGLGLIWNATPCYDYFMTQTKGADYLKSAGMPDAVVQHYTAMPMWMTADWAIGVWGGLLGTILLLMKSRLAVPVYVVSLVAFVVSVLYATIIRPIPGAAGSSLLIFDGVIFAVCVFLVWYSMAMKKKGVLA